MLPTRMLSMPIIEFASVGKAWKSLSCLPPLSSLLQREKKRKQDYSLPCHEVACHSKLFGTTLYPIVTSVSLSSRAGREEESIRTLILKTNLQNRSIMRTVPYPLDDQLVTEQPVFTFLFREADNTSQVICAKVPSRAHRNTNPYPDKLREGILAFDGDNRKQSAVTT